MSVLPRAPQRERRPLRALLVETVAHRTPLLRGLAFPLSTIRARAFCRWRRSPTRRPTTARAAVRYDEIARTLVQGFKYSDRLDLAPMMGRWTARAGRELLADADALVPVPLHWRRQWTRRFNQSAALAGAISAICNVPVAYGFKRVRATPQQVGRSKTERADNVQGAFRVPAKHKADIAGRRLVLIDDVLTSGRNGRCLRAGAIKGRCRPYRRSGIRAGCSAHTRSHIKDGHMA